MPSRLATSLTAKLCGGNNFFNTVSFLSGEYPVTHCSVALCSINDGSMRVTTSLTQADLRRVKRINITIDLLKDLFQNTLNEIKRINWFSEVITDL
jgi:hypothetical protein